MMPAPTVSVILTSYNQAPWLRQSIDSVLAQTFPDWELLAVDNGSTDSSPDIIRSYESDPRVTMVRYERNTAHTVVSNDAVRRARGRHISILYSDDYYLPEKLERQAPALDRLPARYGAVYSGGFRLMADGRMVEEPCGTADGNVLAPLLTGPQLFRPIAPLVRRECMLRYPFDESLFMEGEGIFTKIALGYEFHPVPGPLVVMRDHEGNAGKGIHSNLKRGVAICDRIFGHPEFPPELRHLRGPLLGDTYRLGGWQTIRRERNYAQGQEWLRAAVGSDPKLRFDPRVVAGLTLSALPRRVADLCLSLLDGAVGAPPPPSGGITQIESPARETNDHAVQQR